MTDTICRFQTRVATKRVNLREAAICEGYDIRCEDERGSGQFGEEPDPPKPKNLQIG
jgi:hypothetical protein